MSDSKRLVSIKQAAEYLNVTPAAVRHMIARGEVAAYRVGAKLIKVDLNQVERDVLRPIVPARQAGKASA